MALLPVEIESNFADRIAQFKSIQCSTNYKIAVGGFSILPQSINSAQTPDKKYRIQMIK